MPGFKSFSGEIRRDFQLLNSADVEAAERLRLILKHCGEPSSADDQAATLAELSRWDGRSMNVYTFAHSVEDQMVHVAQAIRQAFAFKDKHTPRWASIYVLLANREGQPPVAEVGVTELAVEAVVQRLRKAESADADTKLGHFLHSLEAERLTCHLVLLESHFGSLDDMGLAKSHWRCAGYQAGVEFPCRPHVGYEDPRRVWPSAEAVAQQRTDLRRVR